MRPKHTGLPLSLAALILLCGSSPLWADEAEEADKKPAVLIIRLPADAELYIGGTKCKQSGESREFDTPPLPPGKKFSYAVKAVWKEDGEERVREAKAIVRAGETTELDLRKQPPPRVVEGPKKTDPPVETKPADKPKEDSKPAPEPAGSFKMELAGTPLTLKPGETRVLTVRLRRDHFKEPVQLRFSGVPAKVAVEKTVLAGDEERAHVQVSAADDAPASETLIDVIAAGGKVTAEGKFKLIVARPAEPKPKPAEPDKTVQDKPPAPTPVLTLHAPTTLTLTPGATKLLPVKVMRTHFEGPVSVKVEGLPAGVEAGEVTVPANKGKVYLSVSAAADAATEGQARLIATSGKVRREVPLEIKISSK